MNTVSNYLSALREAMKAQGLDALVIPSADPHLSEYLPAALAGAARIVSFTGSVGTFVLTADEAGVWVDSRYWEQAAKQLSGSGIELQKSGQVPPYNEWLAANLPKKRRRRHPFRYDVAHRQTHFGSIPDRQKHPHRTPR